MKNYYQILDLSNYAKYSEIAQRHFDLTCIFIQNRKKGDYSTIEFELQTEAFYLLKNPKRKVRYDRLHAIKFANRAIKRSKILKKWELEISEEIIEANTLAKELAELTNPELVDRNKKLQRTSWTGRLWDTSGLIFEFFSFFLSA